MYVEGLNINKVLKLTKVNIKSGGIYMQNKIEKKVVNHKKEHVILTTSQKQLLENMKLTSKEPLAEVFERILEEKERLTNKLEEQFNKTVIQQHNQEVKKHFDRINELNIDIEKKAKDLIDLEIRKYLESVNEVEETIVLLADTKKELEYIKRENEELSSKYNNVNQELEREVDKNKKITILCTDLEIAKNKYITKFNESSTEVNRLNQQNTDLKSKINDKNNEITKIINDNKNELTKFENEINNLKVNIETRDTKIAELNKVIEDLKIDKKDFKDSLKEVNSSIKVKDDSISKLNETQADLVKSNNKLEQELRSSNSKISILREEIKVLNYQLNKLTEEKSSL